MTNTKDLCTMNQLNLTDNLFTILNQRYQFEKIVSFRKSYDLPNYNSDIDSLNYFVKNGAKNNRFRKSFEDAMGIAKNIIKSYENEKTNISGVYRQEK